jgi:hypothetical protein
METKVGVGFSENPKSQDAGAEAARAALAEAGVSTCDLAIMYSTSMHDPVSLRDGVRSVIGPTARLIGGYSVGIITKDMLGYDGCQVGVAVMSSESMKVDMFIEKDLTDNEYNVGLALGNQIKNKKYTDTPNILLMYDFVKGEPSESMYWNKNWATPLIEGMGQSLGTWPSAAGFGMIGDWQCKPTYQWFDQRVEQHAAMALVFSGGVRMDTIIMHGTRPSSGYHTITKSKDNIILEIDGKPAADMMAELLGPESYKNWIDNPFFVTFGVNKGDKFSQFKEENYANRLVAGVDKDSGGLIMSEPDLKVGTEVQLMRRSIDFEYIGERAESLLKRVKDENRKPFFALYIDCAGRTSLYCGTDGEEAEEVQKFIGTKMPLLGTYSGNEIAKVGGDMQVMGWSGVLCVFSE